MIIVISILTVYTLGICVTGCWLAYHNAKHSDNAPLGMAVGWPVLLLVMGVMGVICHFEDAGKRARIRRLEAERLRRELAREVREIEKEL